MNYIYIHSTHIFTIASISIDISWFPAIPHVPCPSLCIVLVRGQSIWDLAALVQEMPEYSPSATASEVGSLQWVKRMEIVTTDLQYKEYIYIHT